MLKIKLFPKGKKHQRTFRIVVAEARSKHNGNVVADIGFYTPTSQNSSQPQNISINKEQLAVWIKNGAQLTLGVDRILNPDKYPKKIKVKKVAEPKVETKPEQPKTEEPKVEEVKSEEVKSEEPKVETKPEETKDEPETPASETSEQK